MPRRDAAFEAIDALTRQTAQLAPPMSVAPPSVVSVANAAEVRVHTTLEDLVPALVRKVAWSGDASRGAVRLELGSGALSGATLLVHAEEGRVRVHLSVPEGVNLGEWRERIARRLMSRGLQVDEIEVR